ncbi:MAG: ParA family protein, partial [Blastochloris sp.]|nr:ParA family protein [Blastochloris sp.]
RGRRQTTTTLALGVEFATLGQRVLLVDLDPSADLTKSLGVDPTVVTTSIADAMLATRHDDRPDLITAATIPTAYGVDLVPSMDTLASVEAILASRIGRELILRTALAQARTTYDVVVVDTPPSLGLLTVSAMCAADEILIPVQAHVLALRNIPQLEESIHLVRELNPTLAVNGILITMVDRRTSLSEAVEDEARHTYHDLVYQTTIPDTTRVAEAPAAGQPISIYAPGSAAARAYQAVAQEVLTRHDRSA